MVPANIPQRNQDGTDYQGSAPTDESARPSKIHKTIDWSGKDQNHRSLQLLLNKNSINNSFFQASVISDNPGAVSVAAKGSEFGVGQHLRMQDKTALRGRTREASLSLHLAKLDMKFYTGGVILLEKRTLLPISCSQLLNSTTAVLYLGTQAARSASL